MGGSHYPIPCSILSTGKNRKTPQRYPDVPTTSWRISIRSMDSRNIDQSAGGKLRDLNAEESWALLEDLALYDNESWNDPRDFAKPVKEIALPQDVPSTSDHRLIELENQVQRLMEAHLALTQPTQVNKITTSCEICSGPHDTQYCIEDPEQACVEYASSRTDKAGGSLELGKNVSAFVQGEVPAKMEDPRLFTLPCRLGDSKPFDTLADLGSCVNIIPLYLFKKLNIGLLEETDHIFGLADGTKSYPVGIVKDVEVHIGKLKLLNDFYVIDMKKDPETPLLVGRGFLATANAVIDCRMAKIAVGEGITRSVFGVKGVDLGEEEAPYWTTLGKRESYKPRPSSDGVGAQTPYYARKDFLDCHLLGEWEVSRDAELNPFKNTLVFRRMVEFLGAIPINLKVNTGSYNPIAWVVSVENKDIWSWFMELLINDLGLVSGEGLTIIYDQHKGIIKAAKHVMPLAEHRQCARHIYANFRKKYTRVQYKNLFWKAAKATYPTRCKTETNHKHARGHQGLMYGKITPDTASSVVRKVSARGGKVTVTPSTPPPGFEMSTPDTASSSVRTSGDSGSSSMNKLRTVNGKVVSSRGRGDGSKSRMYPFGIRPIGFGVSWVPNDGQTMLGMQNSMGLPRHAWPEGITPQDCIIHAATQFEIALSQSRPVESQEEEPRQQQPSQQQPRQHNSKATRTKATTTNEN
ncbi:MAK10-like protein [Tanacetum coccineum]